MPQKLTRFDKVFVKATSRCKFNADDADDSITILGIEEQLHESGSTFAAGPHVCLVLSPLSTTMILKLDNAESFTGKRGEFTTAERSSPPTGNSIPSPFPIDMACHLRFSVFGSWK